MTKKAHLRVVAGRAGEGRPPGAETAVGAVALALVEDGALAPAALAACLDGAAPAGPQARLARLRAHLGPGRLEAAFARHFRLGQADLAATPPDARLIEALGPARCLRLGVVPWRRAGSVTLVATARPDRFPEQRPALEAALGPVRPVLAAPEDIRAALLRIRGRALALAAERHAPGWASCRGFARLPRAVTVVAALQGLLALTLLAPLAVFAALAAWAVLTMLATTGLKLAALAAVMGTRRRHSPSASAAAPELAALRPHRPEVSVIVPLYRETAIAERLIRRLARLSYPKDRLEVLLAVEADDRLTRETLAGLDLPHWIRPVTVPGGTLKTKPRALNFVLDFCRGEIVGVWDAEDAPAPDQIEAVVDRFRTAPAEVACLQGVLDFYNRRRNWLSRCFAIEYAAWFRVVLPGLARLGLVLPLGGTTIFLRRQALEEVGRWDAHNVTEDADLGVRLARFGYRTELIDTVTEEEANSWAWPWVRQRSRWLKGYAMTWAVHMRAPRRLWAELGPRRFLGFQVLFLGTLSQFALAPVIWSFWLMIFGLPHPMGAVLPHGALQVMWGGFILAEAVNVGTGMLAVALAGRQHRFLIPWVPTLHLYYPLAALAVLKGLAEVLYKPFFWDKTEHGAFHDAGPEAEKAA